MTTATYALVGDRKAQEDCNFEGGQYLEYMPGKSLCFYLTRAHDSSQCSNNDVTTVGSRAMNHAGKNRLRDR